MASKTIHPNSLNGAVQPNASTNPLPQPASTAPALANPLQHVAAAICKLLNDANATLNNLPEWALHGNAFNPNTRQIVEYPKLSKSSDSALWQVSNANKIGHLAQGHAYQPKKDNSCCIQWTVGSNLIDYPGDVSTKTADLSTIKLLLNSVMSTKNAKFMTGNLKDFYIGTPMEQYKYMQISIHMLPQTIIDQYNLTPQWICNSQNLSSIPTPTTPITCSLPLNKIIKSAQIGLAHNTVASPWNGITTTAHATYPCLNKLSTSPNNFNIKLPLHPTTPQHAPHAYQPPNYGAKTQFAPPPNTLPALNAAKTKQIQEVLGTLLFYSHAVGSTLLLTTGKLAAQQSSATQHTMDTMTTLLNYCATHPKTKVQYSASDMILAIESNALYLSVSKAHSCAARYYFLTNKRTNASQSYAHNGAVHVMCQIMNGVSSSASKAELGALFHNGKKVVPCALH